MTQLQRKTFHFWPFRSDDPIHLEQAPGLLLLDLEACKCGLADAPRGPKRIVVRRPVDRGSKTYNVYFEYAD